MFKEYLIVDDVFENPWELIELSRKVTYDQNKINPVDFFTDVSPNLGKPFDSGDRHWCGFRSNFLHNIDNNIFCSSFNDIFRKIFNSYKFLELNYTVDAHLHFLPECCICSNDNFHIDESDQGGILMAGVVYLNPTPEKDAGTILVLEDDHQHVIENKFNRLALYNSRILHRPQRGFGKNIADARLTLTFFIKKIEIKS
jgi:hypothetical protein